MAIVSSFAASAACSVLSFLMTMPLVNERFRAPPKELRANMKANVATIVSFITEIFLAADDNYIHNRYKHKL